MFAFLFFLLLSFFVPISPGIFHSMASGDETGNFGNTGSCQGRLASAFRGSVATLQCRSIQSKLYGALQFNSNLTFECNQVQRVKINITIPRYSCPMDVSIPRKTEDQNLPPMRSNNPPQPTSISQIGNRNFLCLNGAL